jgi:hypothetical protein
LQFQCIDREECDPKVPILEDCDPEECDSEEECVSEKWFFDDFEECLPEMSMIEEGEWSDLITRNPITRDLITRDECTEANWNPVCSELRHLPVNAHQLASHASKATEEAGKHGARQTGRSLGGGGGTKRRVTMLPGTRQTGRFLGGDTKRRVMLLPGRFAEVNVYNARAGSEANV